MEDVFDMVFPPYRKVKGAMFVGFECYLDDSKDGKQEFAYVCAGFYATKNAWQRFNRAWDDRLKIEKIDYYKTSEFKSLTKQFSRFRKFPKPYGRELATQVKERLEQVAYDCPGIHGVGIAVPVADYKAVLAHDSANFVFREHEIYHRAFETALWRATQLACGRIRGTSGIMFAHDDEDDFDRLRALYRSFKKNNPKTAAYMRGFHPLDDKVTPALQIADMLANSVMGTTVGHLTRKVGTTNDDIFMFDRSKLSVWDQELGTKLLAGNMRSRKIPLPASLLEALRESGPKNN